MLFILPMCRCRYFSPRKIKFPSGLVCAVLLCMCFITLNATLLWERCDHADVVVSGESEKTPRK